MAPPPSKKPNQQLHVEPRPHFPRVWSNKDEIILLRSMIDYTNKGLDPNTTSAARLFRPNFQYDFSVRQIRAKMHGCRKKYVNAVNRCQDGVDPVYSRPHDCLVFDLSKIIWAHCVRKDDNHCLLDDDNLTRVFRSKYPHLKIPADGLAEDFPSLGISPVLIANLEMHGDSEEMRELEKEWEKLLIREKEVKDEMKAMVRKRERQRERKRAYKNFSTNGEI